MKARSDPATEA